MIEKYTANYLPVNGSSFQSEWYEGFPEEGLMVVKSWGDDSGL